MSVVVLHVVAADQNRAALQVISRPDASGWTAWSPLPTLPKLSPGGLEGETVASVDAALVDAELHVCVVTVTSRLLHTLRDASGVWQPFWGDVGGAAGLPSSAFEIRDVATAQGGGNLHVFATALTRGGSGRIVPVYRAVRSVSAAWTTQFEEINGGQFPGTGTIYGQLTAGDVAGQLHLCARGYWGNELWHTIQFSPPPQATWQPFNDVRPVVPNGPAGLGVPALCGVGSNMHLCVLNAGSIQHTIRMSNPPSWQNPEGSGVAQWGNVLASTVGVAAGSVISVDCAPADGNLHICCVTSDGRLHHTIRASGPPPQWENPEGSGNPAWGEVIGAPSAFSVFGLVATAGT